MVRTDRPHHHGARNPSLDRLAGGDLRGAEAQVLQAARRADELSFPQGPFSLAFARFFEIWIRIEARSSIAPPPWPPNSDHADRHGFEVWALWGAAQQAIVDAMDSICVDDSTPTCCRFTSRGRPKS